MAGTSGVRRRLHVVFSTFHSAINFSYHCPAALPILPGRMGVSHSSAELDRPQQLLAGVRALADAVPDLARAPGARV